MSRGKPKIVTPKTKILKRLKIANGHLKKIVEMVDNDRYCIEVIDQIIAVQSALGEINKVILRNHLEGCVADAFEKGEKEAAINEVMRVMTKMKK